MMFAIISALSVECLVVGPPIIFLWESMEKVEALTKQQKSCLVWNQRMLDDNIKTINQQLQPQ